jgi:hypothetical protein
MSKPQEVEVWPCDYTAKCSVPWCRRPATTILRYLDAQGRPYRQTDVCEIHALGHGYSDHFALPRWETKTKVRYVKLAIWSKRHRRRECQPAIDRVEGSVGIDSHYVAGA